MSASGQVHSEVAVAEADMATGTVAGRPNITVAATFPESALSAIGSGYPLASAAAAAVKEPAPVDLRGAGGNPLGNLPRSSVVRISRTPRWLTGHCNTVWTSSVGKYKLPYRVEFKAGGYFIWWAPLAIGVGEEVGIGAHLSPLRTTWHHDGSWEASYFAANRFTPDETNSTNCCCEYIGQGAGVGKPFVLADYCTAIIPHSSHLPFEEVCAAHIRQCPLTNATALAEMGPPFIEVYSPCLPFGEGPEQVLLRCVVLLVAVIMVVRLARVMWTANRIGLPQKRGLNEALL